jgi:hypothetical protein
MRKFVYTKNGEPSYTVVPSDDVDLADNVSVFEVPFDEDESYIYERIFYKNGQRFEREPRPTDWHEWDSTSESWLPTLDAAREAKKQQVAAELNTRLYLPCNGFDADKVSRDRISGMIARLQRGDGLPAGWVGWRDASNQQQWATDDAATVLANLTALSRAIEDREQALLVAGWAHKANIAALEDIDAILAYDVTKNWPT